MGMAESYGGGLWLSAMAMSVCRAMGMCMSRAISRVRALSRVRS